MSFSLTAIKQHIALLNMTEKRFNPKFEMHIPRDGRNQETQDVIHANEI